MRWRINSVVFVCLALFVWPLPGPAMFMWQETKEVPIGPLLKNLQTRLAGHPNDFETAYHLARLHSMAYATNAAVVNVGTKSGKLSFNYPGADDGTPKDKLPEVAIKRRKEGLSHLTNAIVLYERATKLLKSSTNKDDVWLVLPLELGHAWCLDQAGRTNDAIKAYRRTLEIAWHKEVVGDFNWTEWVKGAWSDVKGRQSPFHSRERGYIGPGVCFSEEVIGYLLKLLDPKRDAAEIKDLQARQSKLRTMGRAITPILVPLRSELVFHELVDTNASVAFDLDGTGAGRRWQWITPKAAWLVFDLEHHGRITSGLQMFGATTFWMFWRDGYDALSALDADGNGVLTGDELAGLALWQDSNGDGVSQPGEVRPISDFGIVAIRCTPDRENEDVIWSSRGVVFSNRTSVASYDWMVPASEK